MSEAPGSTSNFREPGRYEIRLKGHLGARWAAWFDGLSLSREDDGTTVIHGPIADQAALYGVLQKVRDTGMPLVSVICLEPDPADLGGPSTNEPRQGTRPSSTKGLPK